MKRSQKEIIMICEEIREMQHEFTLCYDPLYGAYFSVSKEILNAQIEALNMRMKLEDYKKSIETL